MDLLVFPNQLFADHPGLKLNPERVILIEDSLFFGDYRYPLRFHKQKLWLHRATMKRYEALLQDRGYATHYLDYDHQPAGLWRRLESLTRRSPSAAEWAVVEPVDFILEKRLATTARGLNLNLEFLPNPGFINLREENQEYRDGKTRWFMADFYKWQRRRLNVMMENGQPAGGKWSFDGDNRKKVPKSLLAQIPGLPRKKCDSIDLQAREYVESNFPGNPGRLDCLYYPTCHRSARRWLDHFLQHRFERFGDFEDAIVQGESWLWHSVLTPGLNVGLLTPVEIVEAALDFASDHDVPINSLEGFVRQVIGWREFMRATYEDLGVQMRTTNFWNHQRAIPASFYTGQTGIGPIDDTILRILKTGYCHHIERLMVLGGFMFLCEFHPDQIYNWFMEMFVDSYDWVMVPNVYAMSQHADGGAITTKPYFSGSSYIRKMSNHPKSDWCDTWDGLYWRWILNHQTELSRNPRWSMMCAMARKMAPEKQSKHVATAEDFLKRLDNELAS